MLITVGCPSCGHRYHIAGKLAGKKVRCNECSNNFRVPVPETMPVPAKRSRKPKAKRQIEGIEGSISGILNSGMVETTAPTTAISPSKRLIPDLGERWTYRGFQLICFSVLGAGATFGFFSPLRIFIGFCILMGIFLLLPIMGAWESFEISRMGRLLGRLLGSEGAKAVQATIAISFWVLAILIGMDTIPIAALKPDPEVKAEHP